MMLPNALQGVNRLLLDTAPIIYFVEQHPQYHARLVPLFAAIDAGTLHAVTSPITLAETLVVPYRTGNIALQNAFWHAVRNAAHTRFVTLDALHARRAAALRSQYNLTLSDALQVAVALLSGCDGILTNDYGLRRIGVLRVVLVDELGA